MTSGDLFPITNMTDIHLADFCIKNTAAAGANASSLALAMDFRNNNTVTTALATTPAGGYLAPEPGGSGYPAIIGGLVVKLGSRMVDSSLRTKLNAIKHAMKEAR